MASLRKRGVNWYVRYRDVHGKQTEVKAGPDKGVAKGIANDLESKVRQIKLGTLDPREAACTDAERIPIAAHVKDYIAVLEARGCVAGHVEGIEKRLTWFLDESKVTRLSQLRPSLAESALKVLRDARRSDRTVAHYAAAVKSFSRWLWKDKRTREDLMSDLERPTIQTKSNRSALTPEQAARLIASTRGGKVRRGMSGTDRSWLYVLAMVTGLRRGELQALRPEDLDLDGKPPVVNLDGQFTKNGKSARQPLPSHLIPALRTWLATKPSYAPIFRADRNSSLMIKADLRDAGIPSDNHCFHELRHCYATWVVQSGASVKDAMELARHSDPDLTLNTYAHTRLEDLARVVDSLPTSNLWASDPSCDFAHTLPTSGVSGGLNGTQRTKAEMRPEAPHAVREMAVGKLPGQDSNLEKQDQNLL
jgi:integrase